jgi:hypothetical protein
MRGEGEQHEFVAVAMCECTFHEAEKKRDRSAFKKITYSQRCGYGFGIRDPVPFWTLDPGSGIGFFRIPNPNFWELSDIFWGKSSIILWKVAKTCYQHFINKIIYNFGKFMATKIGVTTNFFHPSLLLLFLDPVSGINIPDPQHCLQCSRTIR